MDRGQGTTHQKEVGYKVYLSQSQPLIYMLKLTYLASSSRIDAD